MDAVRTLQLGTESNGRPQPDDRWPFLLLAGLSDCIVDAGKIATSPSAWDLQWSMTNALVAVVHVKDLPTVGCETPLDVLSKRDGGVSVDGNV